MKLYVAFSSGFTPKMLQEIIQSSTSAGHYRLILLSVL